MSCSRQFEMWPPATRNARCIAESDMRLRTSWVQCESWVFTYLLNMCCSRCWLRVRRLQQSILGNTLNNDEQFWHHVVWDWKLELTHSPYVQLPGRHVHYCPCRIPTEAQFILITSLLSVDRLYFGPVFACHRLHNHKFILDVSLLPFFPPIFRCLSFLPSFFHSLSLCHKAAPLNPAGVCGAL